MNLEILVLVLTFLLFQTRALISKVTEERNSIVEKNKRLQQEVVWNLFRGKKKSFKHAFTLILNVPIGDLDGYPMNVRQTTQKIII